MLSLELDDLQAGYLRVVDAVLVNGRKIAPRGQQTIEVSPATLIFRDPAAVVPVGIGRKLRLEIGAAESAQLLGGLSDAAQLVAIAPRFAAFVEDDDRLRGAYGPRTHDQFPRMIELLVRDPDSRQASVMIWRHWDLARPSRDVPCTVQLQFLIRQGRLHMIVQMRSNDVFWGLAYDAWVFANVQHAVAYALGINVGTYYHHATSLHIYVDRDREALAALHAPDKATEVPPMLAAVHHLRSDSGERALERWHRIVVWARQAVGIFRRTGLDGGAKLSLPASVTWYRDRLRPFWSGGILCPSCRYVLPRSEPHYPIYNQDDHQRRCRRCAILVHRDMTPDDYEALWALQDGRCGICREQKPLVLDHDHVSGVTRGLLCRMCNVALGMIKDGALADAIKTYTQAPPWKGPTNG